MDEQQLPFPHAVQEQPATFLYRRDGQPAAQPLQDDPLVAYTVLGSQDGDRIYLSTAFLGVDASLGFSPEPLLWESVVIGGPMHGLQERYASEEAAAAGHRQLLSELDDAMLQHGWDAPTTPAPTPEPAPAGVPRDPITGEVDLDVVAASLEAGARIRHAAAAESVK